MSDDLKIIHFNTQGFQNKLTGINNFVKVHKPDILVITEHFQKNVNDLDGIDGYKIVNSFCRKHNERGGVAIWAKDNIQCKPRKDLDRHRKEREFELVSISVGDDVVVTGAYRPPSTSIPDFHTHLGRFIKKINKEPHIKHVLTGDFNIDNSKPNKTRTVLSENDLMFHITTKTHRKGRCIDNFITNFDLAKSRVIKSKISNISDHHPIEIIVQKEARMIAKKKDPFIYKLFEKILVKNTQVKKKEMKSPQWDVYGLFSKRTNNGNGNVSKSNSNNADKLPNRNSAEKDKYQIDKPKPSFLSKLFAFLNPWHTTTQKEHVKPSVIKKEKFISKETTVTTQSFFSKIKTLISFAIQLFKSDSSIRNEPSTTVEAKEENKDSLENESKPKIFSFFSKIFNNI